MGPCRGEQEQVLSVEPGPQPAARRVPGEAPGCAGAGNPTRDTPVACPVSLCPGQVRAERRRAACRLRGGAMQNQPWAEMEGLRLRAAVLARRTGWSCGSSPKVRRIDHEGKTPPRELTSRLLNSRPQPAAERPDFSNDGVCGGQFPGASLCRNSDRRGKNLPRRVAWPPRVRRQRTSGRQLLAGTGGWTFVFCVLFRLRILRELAGSFGLKAGADLACPGRRCRIPGRHDCVAFDRPV